MPSNLLGSFRDLFSARIGADKAVTTEPPQDGQVNSVSTAPATSTSPPPRLVFFGEQHHQPQVMRAQLQTLHALHQQCQLASNKADSSSPIYRVHLVLEHFSVLDQEMLTSFSHGKLGPDELAETYQTKSEEAFHIGHYMPLLMLAKELKVPIWGGFPPRSWARQVFRDGVDGVKDDEQRRVESVDTGRASQEEPAPVQQAIHSKATLRPPLFTAWSAVTKISAAHRSYLSGLMRPDLPPRFPQLPDAKSDPTTTDVLRQSPIYPTWLLKPHNIETKGFGPAQALKDSYLAHVTAWILRGAQPDNSDTSGEEVHSRTEAADIGRPVVNVALVVCGLGHCEYGFGAPERVVQLLSRQDASSSDASSTLLPYIIASKPLDSGIWLGYEHAVERSDAGATNTAVPAQASVVTERKASPEAVKRWLDDSWGAKWPTRCYCTTGLMMSPLMMPMLVLMGISQHRLQRQPQRLYQHLLPRHHQLPLRIQQCRLDYSINVPLHQTLTKRAWGYLHNIVELVAIERPIMTTSIVTSDMVKRALVSCCNAELAPFDDPFPLTRYCLCLVALLHPLPEYRSKPDSSLQFRSAPDCLGNKLKTAEPNRILRQLCRSILPTFHTILRYSLRSMHHNRVFLGRSFLRYLLMARRDRNGHRSQDCFLLLCR